MFNNKPHFLLSRTMFFHVIVTNQCNSECRYCFGEAMLDEDDDFGDLNVDYALPKRVSYDLEMLSGFCSRDPECVVTFYGGEPLLGIDLVREIMNEVKAKFFMMQTNGLLLSQLEPEYVNRLHTILVSLDGDEATTDFNRGNGTFRKVVDSLKLVKRNGFQGELIARMTVMEPMNVYDQVTWLVENEELPFSSVHWQLNAGFWKTDFSRRKFKTWSHENYDPGVRKLAKYWVDIMERTGVVLRLYPFLGIAHSFLHGEKNSFLRCGGGWTNYTIQTDGYIVPCPTMWGMRDYYLGHISNADPLELSQVFVKGKCAECGDLGMCGGRCLYANVTKRWSPEAYEQVCKTVRSLIQATWEQIPRIEKLVEKGKTALEDFEYMKYNGCEIIP
jgi:uncharacterized protein